MNLKLVDKNNGTWCIHIAESDEHLAYMMYKGSGSWKLEIGERNSSVSVEFKADTVDEAVSECRRLLEKQAAAQASNPSNTYSEKAIIFNEILALYFRAFSASGIEGQNEYLNIMSNALGNAIAMTGADAERIIAGTCEIMRETITARQSIRPAENIAH